MTREIEALSTSLDALMFDFMAFVMQQLNQLKDCLVSRHSVIMLVIVIVVFTNFVHCLAQLGTSWSYFVFLLL